MQNAAKRSGMMTVSSECTTAVGMMETALLHARPVNSSPMKVHLLASGTDHFHMFTCVCLQSRCHGTLQSGCHALLAVGLAYSSARCSGSLAGCAACWAGSTRCPAAHDAAALHRWGRGHTRALAVAAAAATAAAPAADLWVRCCPHHCCCLCCCCLYAGCRLRERMTGMVEHLGLLLLLCSRGWAAGVTETACTLHTISTDDCTTA
jgi:hypothetical protein